MRPQQISLGSARRSLSSVNDRATVREPTDVSTAVAHFQDQILSLEVLHKEGGSNSTLDSTVICSLHAIQAGLLITTTWIGKRTSLSSFFSQWLG